ncbi:MAG TPA: hypothetical protein VK708_03715, partial [Bryobacteraceae bacterium]|nr:hypothetical protein [Bryobacteraceae bacterium]
IVTLSGSQAPLAAGADIDFGKVTVGDTHSLTVLLSNPASSSITVSTVSVSGSDFSGPAGLKTPVSIDPGQSASFQIAFAPQSGAPYQGMLTVDGRAFNLSGQGLAPALPTASILFASNLGASGQQNSVTLPLASASETSGTGTLTIAFQPSVAGVTDDAAIQFLSGPFRKATVTIAKGETSALIGGQASMGFQTGTTAGSITFTLTLNGLSSQQATLTIPPSPINIDSATAVRLFGSLNVAFAGFDNTYSASELAFTFYDITGKALPQGAIDVNASADFQQYFSATQAGGSFQVLATFPVTGNSAEIGFVTAQVTNSLGTTSAQQISIGN